MKRWEKKEMNKRVCQYISRVESCLFYSIQFSRIPMISAKVDLDSSIKSYFDHRTAKYPFFTRFFKLYFIVIFISVHSKEFVGIEMNACRMFGGSHHTRTHTLTHWARSSFDSHGYMCENHRHAPQELKKGEKRKIKLSYIWPGNLSFIYTRLVIEKGGHKSQASIIHSWKFWYQLQLVHRFGH